jgi:peptide/nickel transport system permease protein
LKAEVFELDLAKVIAKRLLRGFLTLFVVSLFIFFSVELLPGDIAENMLGRDATPEAVAALRTQLGLDQPPHLRYLGWISGVLKGDFGVAISSGRQVSDLVVARLSNTFFLAGFTALIAVPLALGLGILNALYRNTLFDKGSNAITLASISVPEFFIAYILIFVFTTQMRWFPAISDINSTMALGERLYRSMLPALTLTMVVTAHMMRMTRASLINLLSQAYVEMARLKGAGQGRVIIVHTLPNAAAPIAAVVALNLAYLITGVVVVESVFVYPGLGQLLVDSVQKRDIPVVQASCILFASTYILLNLLADIIAIVTNPRLMHPR